MPRAFSPQGHWLGATIGAKADIDLYCSPDGSRVTKCTTDDSNEENDDAESATPLVYKAYGERFDGGTRFQTLVAVETAQSIEAGEAQARECSFAEWTSGTDSRRMILFVPKEALRRARQELPRYHGYVVFGSME